MKGKKYQKNNVENLRVDILDGYKKLSDLDAAKFRYTYIKKMNVSEQIFNLDVRRGIPVCRQTIPNMLCIRDIFKSLGIKWHPHYIITINSSINDVQ